MPPKLKRPPIDGGAKIAPPPPEFSSAPELRPPVFSLQYVQHAHCISACTKDEKAALIDKIHRLSSLTWAQIKQADRHGLGFEKIARTSIKGAIPKHLTPDVDLIAFRFDGKKPMVGYRREATFFILWLDRTFTLYDHS